MQIGESGGSAEITRLMGDLAVQPGKVEQPKGHSTQDTLGVSNKQGIVENVPTDPSKPVLAAAKEIKNLVETQQQALTVINANPYLKATPMGHTLALYADILALFAESSKMDRETKIKSMGDGFDLKMMAAELAKLNKESQATEEITKAIASFGEATVSFVEFSKSMGGQGPAEEKYAGKLNEADAKINEMKMQLADAQPAPVPSLTQEQINTFNRDHPDAPIPDGAKPTYAQIQEFDNTYPNQDVIPPGSLTPEQIAIYNQDHPEAPIVNDQPTYKQVKEFKTEDLVRSSQEPAWANEDFNGPVGAEVGDIEMEEMGQPSVEVDTENMATPEAAQARTEKEITDFVNEQKAWMESDAGKAVLDGHEELKTLVDQKKDLVTKKEDMIQRFKDEGDRATSQMASMGKSIINGWASSMNAFQKSTQAVLGFNEATLQAQADMLNKLEQTKDKSVSDVSQSFNQLIQGMGQMEDAAARLMRLGQA